MSTGSIDVNGKMTESSMILTESKRGTQVNYSVSTEQISPSMMSSSDTQQLVEAKDSSFALKSSTPFASFNYINSIIGSGIIGMPYALHQAGFGVGVILLFVVAIVTDYSLVLLIKGGLIAGTSTYQGLMEAAFGRPGFYILSVIQFVYPVIAMISYNIIIGDTLTKVMVRVIGSGVEAGIFGNRYFIIALVTLFITMPISLYRQLAKLGKISLLSLVFVLFIVVAIVYRWGTLHDSVVPTEDSWQFANTGITQAIGVMTFAYMCHHNSFLLYDTLPTPSQGSWNRMTHASIVVALVLFLVLGVFGYATFTGHSQGDILENYCISDDLMNAVRIGFSVAIMLTYPIECFVAREVLENMFFHSWNTKPTYVHVSLTVTIVLFAFVISLATDCLGVVLELNGVMAAVPLAYILPAICYLKLKSGPMFTVARLPAILTAFFGTVVSVVGLYLTFAMSVGGSCSHGHEMPYCETVPTVVTPVLRPSIRQLALMAVNGSSLLQNVSSTLLGSPP